ncbi:type I methionyl aminopeptidase [Candidatus Gracilibacteria bacterium]|nr:type I methionyl aminopeptidase [Candidatus Gracilibacteria bacterium]
MSKIYIKNEKEIELMRKAGKILRVAQLAVLESVREGVSLEKLDNIAESIIRNAGGIPGFKGYRGFPKTLCTMINSEIVHGIPDSRKLKNGDLLSVDCGVIYKDLNADAAFSVVVGGEGKNLAREKFCNCVKAALEAGCSAARLGNYVGDIGHAIERVVKKGGYRLVEEYTGHGIGYELHEDPHVFNYGNPKTGARLKEGMTICIEPIVSAGKPDNKTLKDGWTVVTLDGKDACQWEYCGVITKDGFEIFA